ncbi:hypothetical protein EMIT019CA3_11023 [Bacillus pseudomycoides]|nr:YoqO family protein [Bacillus pseudomycoides]
MQWVLFLLYYIVGMNLEHTPEKKKIVLGIEFVILIATVPFILLEGGRQMDMMPIFQGWLSFARLVYLLIILGIVGMIVTKVNKKLLLGDDVSKT